MILAGDVGGTKIHLAIFEESKLARGAEIVLATPDVGSLASVVEGFVREHSERIVACALGVPGPVFGGEVVGANLPWKVTEDEIRAVLGGAPTRLLNDLAASAQGLVEVDPDGLQTLHPGRPVEGAVRAIVSPGTGLGEVVIARTPSELVLVGSEAGHSDFAPRTDEEFELARFLRARFGRVSVERVVSGPGLVNVYCWLRDGAGRADDAGVEAAPGDSLPAKPITRAAAEGSELAREALRVWTGAFGAEVGNVALRAVPRGGIYLGGGMPGRVFPIIDPAIFVAAFRDKAPQEHLVREIPVHLLLDTETTLKGAARVAAELVV